MSLVRLASLRFLFLAAAALALPTLGCGGGGGGGGGDDVACNNGLDDDADGLIDLADPGCESATDTDESNVVKPQCSDNIDNDGDGKTDFPADPGCLNSNQNDETDDCPDGPNCPECSNGKDDDEDGKIDADDPGCSTARDTTEEEFNSTACGPRVTVKPMPSSGKVSGTLDLAASHLISAGDCGGLGSEIAYQVTVTEPTVIVASTAVAGTVVDTVVYVRGADCSNNSELICNNDASPTSKGSTVQASLDPGVYFVIVDGNTNSSAGTFNLEVTSYKGHGQTCDPQVTNDCAPGFFCRMLPGQTGPTCQPPRCGDGADDDSGTLDGKTDYPLDPGCDSLLDDTEDDDCPSGPNCPACSNTMDDDTDGATDYPMDPSCGAASGTSESCTSTEPVGAISGGTTAGTTAGATSDRDPSCGSTGSPDRLYQLTVPQLESLSISANASGFEYVLELLNSSCGGSALACTDAGTISRSNVTAGTYFVSVDGYFDTSSGPFTLQVSGVIAAGGRCDGGLYASGALTCATGSACNGTICKGSKQCNDGDNNDTDTFTDYPNDPGCDSPQDDSEADDCPSGPNCPVCSNGADDDDDTFTDYPNDPSCGAASGMSEGCAASEPIGVLTQPTTSGTTSGSTNDVAPTCGSSSNSAGDMTFSLDVPRMKSLNISTNASFDAVTVMLDSSCTGSEIACEDFSDIALGATPAGRYYVIVDGWSSGTGTFDLTVSGQIVAGQSCESALAQSGALTCTAGFACSGMPGSRTCQVAACHDGLNNDGDAKADYPNDPGCDSPSDNDETDDCPSGPNCPACGNGLDDDTDGLFDYPFDDACLSAASRSESCSSSEPIATLTMGVTTGTTLNASNDMDPSCGSSSGSGPDLLYQLDLPKLDSLEIDTPNSFDTIFQLFPGSCGAAALTCTDFPPATLNNLAAGTYYLNLDGWSSSSLGAFEIDIAGVIASGGRCDGDLALSGALTCKTGTTCTAGTCQ